MADVQTTTETAAATTTAADTTTQTTVADTTASTTANTDATILSTDTTADTTQVTVQADWPTDWQDKMAGGNAEVLKIIKRYSSPANAAAALAAAQQKIRSGKVTEPLTADATPEQVAEYRKATGVPETAEGYKLPEGIVPDEGTKTYLKSFYEEMHAAHVPQGVVEKALGAYFKNVEAAASKQAEDDLAFHQTSDMSIRKEWGPSYKGNINAIMAMLATHPKEVQDNILNARLGNGQKLASDPATLRAFLSMAKDINPAAMVIPGGIEAGKGIDDRLAEINGQMKTMGQAKWHAKGNEGLRTEHLQLIEAQQKMKQQQSGR